MTFALLHFAARGRCLFDEGVCQVSFCQNEQKARGDGNNFLRRCPMCIHATRDKLYLGRALMKIYDAHLSTTADDDTRARYDISFANALTCLQVI